MERKLSDSMWDALVEAFVLLGRASEAAGEAGPTDDAVMVTQRVDTVQSGLSLVVPELAVAAVMVEDEQSVTPSLRECQQWLLKAAGVLDDAVLSGTPTLLPVGLLTVRADLADTIRLVDGLKVTAP